jgi:threonine aldolase
MTQRLPFSCDYLQGCHPAILQKLSETNLEACDGYGSDPYTLKARELILKACQLENGEVFLLSGGTQANLIVISAALQRYQAVISADTGHINCHEGGSIEAGGHKILALPHDHGKIRGDDLEKYMANFTADANNEHMAQPAMVYISQPTEYGTLYSAEELKKLHQICRKYGLLLYCDGARLAYGLAAKDNDVTLPLLAEFCDIFYIGGTKCGALLGEAVVFSRKGLISHFFTTTKQMGGILAKGKLLGIQFATLFEDDLYLKVGQSAINYADQIRTFLKDNGYQLFFDTPTNQIFIIISDEKLKKLGEKVSYSYWEKYDDQHTVIRLATSWATNAQQVEELLKVLKEI